MPPGPNQAISSCHVLAKVFDDDAGYHQFISEDGNEHGSFEVFWAEDGDLEDDYPEDDDKPTYRPGWYWWACFSGCLPDGEPSGPFSTSYRAYADAREEY